MEIPLLQTKLYIPPTRTDVVPRPRAIEQLNDGLNRKLALILTSAGFGKTTMLSYWAAQGEMPISWVSLDDSDNDPTRFLSCFIATLQALEPDLG